MTLSLNLLDETVRALRTSVVDDVHLSLRIADLLERLTSSIRHRFVRLARQSHNKSTNASPDRFRLQSSGKSTHAEIPAGDNIDPNTISTTYQPSKFPNTPDPIVIDPTDYNTIAIITPRDMAYNFPTPTDPTASSYNNLHHTPSSSTTTYYDYQHQQQPYSNPPTSTTTTDEAWLTLDLNPLLADTGTGGFGSWNGDATDWIGGFGPEITSNLEVLGKLANEGYRTEGWEGGFG